MLLPACPLTVSTQAVNTAPDITLQYGALISGSVVDDATGEKLPDVLVVCWGTDNRRRRGDTTTSDGLYKLRLVAGSYDVHVQAAPAGYARPPRVELTVENGETHTVDLRLKKGLTLTGTVVDEQGQPADGVNVSLAPYDQRYEKTGARTDSTGAYHLDGLTPGSYSLTAIDPQQRWLTPTSPLRGIIVSDRGVNTAPDLTLQTGALITGSVLDDVTGAKLPDHSVVFLRAQNPRSNNDRATTTDGRYTFRVAPGAYGVQIMQAPLGYAQSAQVEVTVSDGETRMVDLRLKKGLSLTGTLVDEQGKAADGVNVVLVPIDQPYDNVNGRSDSKGAYYLDGLHPGDYTLTLSDPQQRWFSPPERQVTVSAQGVNTVLGITLQVGPTISVSVRDDATSARIPRVAVTLREQNNSASNNIHLATDGQYKYCVAPGSYEVQVLFPPVGYVSSPAIEVTVGAGESRAVDIRLKKGLTLTGTFVNEQGEPAAGVNVGLYATDQLLPQRAGGRINTDTHGAYHFDGLLPGAYRLTAQDPQQRWISPPERELTVSDTGVNTVPNITLHAGALISGAIIDEQGHPAAGAVLNLTVFAEKDGRPSRNDRQFTLTAGADGHFSVSGLPAGNARISHGYSHDHFPVWELNKPLTLDIPATQPLTVTVRKLATQALSGRVVSSGGAPLSGAEVTLSAQLYGTVQRELLTDADGRYSLPDVPADCQIELLSVEKSGYLLVTSGTMTNANGQFTLSDCVLALRNATINGTVIDADGKAVAAARLFSLEEGALSQLNSDAAGAFTLRDLPEGDAHLLAVSANGCALWQGTTRVTTVRLTLRPNAPPAPGDLHALANLLAADDQRPSDQQRFDHTARVETIATKDASFASSVARREWPTLPDGVRSAMLVTLARTDPDHAASVGIDQLDRIYDDTAKFTAAIALGLAVAKTHPDVAAQCYALASAQNTPQYAPYILDRIAHNAQLLQLATMLGNDDRDRLTAAIIADIDKTGDFHWDVREVVPIVARYLPDMAEKLCAIADPEKRINLMEVAIPPVAAVDAAKAQQLLATLQEDLRKRDEEGPDEPMAAVIRALGKTDPAAALALARQPDNRFDAQRALVVAAAFQPRADAFALYREAAGTSPVGSLGDAAVIARIAAGAYRLDPAEGRRLLDPALKYVMGGKFQALIANAYWGNLGDFAYFAGPMAPQEIRPLLEIVYRQELHQLTRWNRWILQSIPRAMAVIDAPRALEMLDELYPKPADRDSKRSAQREIFRYIAASDEERLTEYPGDR